MNTTHPLHHCKTVRKILLADDFDFPILEVSPGQSVAETLQLTHFIMECITSILWKNTTPENMTEMLKTCRLLTAITNALMSSALEGLNQAAEEKSQD